jgi:hypothetical protein
LKADRVAIAASAQPRWEGGQGSGTGAHLVADGAAVHVGAGAAGRWLALRFECDLSADQRQVVAFAFAIGEEIPKQRWEEMGLPTEAR